MDIDLKTHSLECFLSEKQVCHQENIVATSIFDSTDENSAVKMTLLYTAHKS